MHLLNLSFFDKKILFIQLIIIIFVIELVKQKRCAALLQNVGNY
ncbi:hypothetical protein BOVAC16_227 [Bacteroides ovatus]|nr:hypothetical protein BOVAC16_227 [Bacteroides ovatus]